MKDQNKKLSEQFNVHGYPTLVVPGCDVLTERQAELVEAYVRDGGRLVVAGELGTNLGDRMRATMDRPDVSLMDAFGFDVGLLPHGQQVQVVDGRTDAAVTLQRVDGGCALHLIRYDYDEADDRVPPHPA